MKAVGGYFTISVEFSNTKPNLSQVCLQGSSFMKPRTEVGIQWTFLFIVPFALLIYPTIFIYILLIKHNNDRLTPQDNIAKAKVIIY